MRTTKDGLALIQGYESCRLQAFLDALGGRWTIGWGRTAGVSEGDVCTQEQADAWFLEDVQTAEDCILACVGSVPLSDNQLSALTSFVYNIGPGIAGVKDGFRVLKSGDPSSMLKFLLMGAYVSAAGEFPKWDHSGGEPIPGLLARRLAEQALFNGSS